MTPEAAAREKIDALLVAVGWAIKDRCDRDRSVVVPSQIGTVVFPFKDDLAELLWALRRSPPVK